MILLGCALIAAAAFLHPYVFYPLTLRWFRTIPLRLRDDQPPPGATLVFCAYNESLSMPEKIANLRAIREVVPGIRFKAYVDLGTDDTLAQLQAQGDLIEVHAAQERTGKALGMRRLVAACDTDIVIFTDANVTLEPESVPRLLRYFSDPEVGGVCGTLIYLNPGDSATAEVNSAYWRLEENIKKAEARSGSTMGADGSIFATRRRLYPVVPEHLLDDFIVSMSVVFANHRLISAPDVRAFEKLAAKSSDEFRRKRRIACRAYSSHRHLWPQIRQMSGKNLYKYLSHRFLRWYGAVSAGLAILFGIAWGFVDLGTGWGLAFTALAVIGLIALAVVRTGPIGRCAEMARAIWATMLGISDSWRGKRYQIWQPIQDR